jgi:ceramide glucosyltransferase
MTQDLLKILSVVFELGALLGCLYLFFAVRVVRRFMRQPRPNAPVQPPVSVLKPLCGVDPGLYENLLSFVNQDYPAFELVCGVQDPADPAIAVVERLRRDRPDVPIALVVETREQVRNLKIANLMNMLPSARYDRLVMVDSDMRATPDFLTTVVAPLEDPAVGLVTSLYRGRTADDRPWSMLGAQYINHAFLPEAVLGETLFPGQGCFGASIAMTRATLEAIGGLAPVADSLADDNALGAAVRRLGKRVRVSTLVIDDWIGETSLVGLFRHELRWALTIRGVAPWGYLGSVVTHPLMLALLAALAGGLEPIPLAVLAVALLGRFAMVRAIDRALGLVATPLWRIPGRDLLSFAVFLTSYCTRTVAWRDHHFHLDRRGHLTVDGDPAA